MTKKIFSSIMLTAACVLLASMITIVGFLRDYFGGIEESGLREELGIAAVGVEDEGTDYLAALPDGQRRFTWIAADGSVIYDTNADADSLENHSDREEFKAALETGAGESVRYSNTLMQKTMYAARRLDDGTVLRVSVSTATVGALLLGVTQPMLAVLAAALILSAILAKHISRRVVAPLNELDLEHPLDDSNAAYEELAPVLGRINRQRSQINSQLRELRRRTDEFAQVTGSMREGLVLLNEQGYILSMNPAARNIFAVEGDCAGKDFLTVDRSCDMSAAVRSAMECGHGRLHERHGGRIYQIDVSRIDSDGAAIGTVILVFDVTEQESAEQMRREFTANVSHELKTPLQGIIGSAELIENGMVQPEDMPRFVGHIRAEAQRLVTLIGDIIRLSQLDEGEVLPKERLDLLEVAQGAADDLQAEAEKKNVHLSVSGESAELEGVRQLIYEVAYNLGDNAIKYNVDGGSVSINVSSDGKNAKLTVSDTGIGIAAEDQSRIFERFYRVDKSHSKESGGTGLGLSIVKHAVQYHGGRISMDSAPGKGTSMSVILPIQ